MRTSDLSRHSPAAGFVRSVPGPAPRWRGFRSFLQGGFECATHCHADGRRVDIHAATGHDRAAEADYGQLAAHGLLTSRDGLRWHLIEPSPGRRDFSSFRRLIRAADLAGVEVIWDLMHFGWPDGLDIWSDDFVERFAAFAGAAARTHRATTDAEPIWCPVNEISWLAWAGGHAEVMNPFATGRADILKRQLARAAIKAIHALRHEDPRARIVLCEPLIHVAAEPADAPAQAAALAMTQAQFQAFDMVVGGAETDLGGSPDLVDAVGLNYYPYNQWRMTASGEHDGILVPGDPLHRPLADLLDMARARYRLPVFIAETGTEGDARTEWFEHVFDQVMVARDRGVPVDGMCLYPITSHLGWCGQRICENGLFGSEPGADRGRQVHEPLAQALAKARVRLGKGI